MFGCKYLIMHMHAELKNGCLFISLIGYFYIPKNLAMAITLPLKFLFIQIQLPYTPSMLTGVGRIHTLVTLASLSKSLNMQFDTEI